ncbi:universal stress protein UspA [Notoacmeibacter marinus]|uniref:Universal stress protein UspA n=1 Tax=Notoacmeibacter marinus TaxID=1876515 RepID=A0A231V159_9HYPH|nr:universal stress protein [Notoacmeibacter marinus]OXT01939.1 universal stress protein UspA [Notoacmeibacter marinus]
MEEIPERLSRKAGRKRKFLAIIDDTPECERAVTYAAYRAQATSGTLKLLYVIQPEPGEFAHWLGVEEKMREEAMDEAERRLSRFRDAIARRLGVAPEIEIREGKYAEQIHELIREDPEIVILVLATSASSEGPGPLVSSIAGRSAAFPIPVTVVPGNLSDEDIETLA